MLAEFSGVATEKADRAEQNSLETNIMKGLASTTGLQRPVMDG